MRELGNGIDFEVIKFCGMQNVNLYSAQAKKCDGCGQCGCGDEVLKYSLPVKNYSEKFQEDINAEIESLMAQYGCSREMVIETMLEAESEVR